VPGEAGDRGAEDNLAAARAHQPCVSLQHQVDINVACSLIDQRGHQRIAFQQRHPPLQFVKRQVRKAKRLAFGDVRFFAGQRSA
jgi:hypothetical protein